MALAYLLSPTFEIVNSAGKPATGGYIEVYVAGSRNKYYCASDFNGTLHPFRIPLDSLGSNIVLAEDTGAYDVYAYNRYGTSLMSRYNVKPGGGGTLAGTITSSDGSISVTPTSTGVDLRVDLEAPSILRATAQSLTGDGLFQFSELQRDGRGATVDVNGRVMLSEGWWHYDATVRLRWPGNPAESGTQSISLYTANGSDSMPFDLSYAHSDTVQINGEFKSATSGTQFILGVLGIPAGLTVELVDFGIHSILGEGAANGRYYAGNGIQINEADRIVSVDTDVVQEKLTAGTAITITDNVISAVIPPQVQADWTEDDTSASSYIQHKPDLSVYATTTDLTDGLATKQDVIDDLSTIRSGAAAGATAVQPGDLATVATTGDYGDLLNTPTIPAALTAGNGIDITNDVVSAKVDGTTIGINSSGELAFQGNVSDIFIAIYGTTTLTDIYDASAAGKAVFLKNPNSSYRDGLIPMYELFWTGTNKFARFVTPLRGASTTGIPSDTKSYAFAYTVGAVTGWNSTPYWTLPETQQADNGKVLKAYNDGTNSSVGWASIPVSDVEVGGTSVVNAQGVAEVPAQVNSDWNSSSGVSEILNKPDLSVYAQTSSLATVATTGDYTDLSNTPSIPVIGTITL